MRFIVVYAEMLRAYESHCGLQNSWSGSFGHHTCACAGSFIRDVEVGNLSKKCYPPCTSLLSREWNFFLVCHEFKVEKW
jgi:hypothetical protein